jgi:hypothetical protein
MQSHSNYERQTGLFLFLVLRFVASALRNEYCHGELCVNHHRGLCARVS